MYYGIGAAVLVPAQRGLTAEERTFGGTLPPCPPGQHGGNWTSWMTRAKVAACDAAGAQLTAFRGWVNKELLPAIAAGTFDATAAATALAEHANTALAAMATARADTLARPDFRPSTEAIRVAFTAGTNAIFDGVTAAMNALLQTDIEAAKKNVRASTGTMPSVAPVVTTYTRDTEGTVWGAQGGTSWKASDEGGVLTQFEPASAAGGSLVMILALLGGAFALIKWRGKRRSSTSPFGGRASSLF